MSVTSQAANDLIYCSSATQLARIAAAASSVLVTSAGSVPSLSTTLPNINIGTPTGGVLTNCTGLPIATGLSGLGAANRIPYATSATAMTTSANLAFDGTDLSVFGEVLAGTGTVSLPAFSFSADPDTGMYRSAANTAALVAGGTAKLGWIADASGRGGISVGPSPQLNIGISLDSTLTLTGASQYGLATAFSFASDATTLGYVVDVQVKTAAASFTMVDGVGLHVSAPSIGAGSAITNLYGLYIAAQSGAATINRAIHTAGGDHYFGGDVKLTATSKLYLDGGSDTYIVESAANTMDFYAGGSLRMSVNSTAVDLNYVNDTSIGVWSHSRLTIANNGSANNLSAISFGYKSTTTNAPGAFALITTSGSGSTKGDFIWALRDVTTDTQPTERMRLGSAGGLQMGAPTGGDKGSGTINTAADIYKNNSAYANPDYVFEHYYTGQIVTFAANDGASDYRGLLPLRYLEAYVKEHYRFPLIPDAPMGVFKRADVALALTEQNTLYLFQHEARIAALEAEIARLRGRRQ